MKKHSKRFNSVNEKMGKMEQGKLYAIEEAVGILKELSGTKFDETCELAFNLGLDLKKLQQPVRGSVNLPNGSGKKLKVLVFAQGENVEKAGKAGADYVGGNELIEKVKTGWIDFQAVVATPDMMRTLAPLGKVLGPRGLMPNPKMGTVTFDLAKIIGELKKGRVEFKMDKDGNVQMPVGKKSFPVQSLVDNITSAVKAVLSAKPAGAKGVYLRSMYLSSTMSPSIPLNINKISQELNIAVS